MKTKFFSIAATLLLAASASAGSTDNYYLVGSFNGWNPETKVEIPYNVETGAFTLTKEIEGEFKIMHNQAWLGSNTSPNFLSPTVYLQDASNISVPSKSTYTFTIKDNQLTVSGFSLYLAGSFNSWGTPLKMNDNGDGTYSLPYMIPENTTFKIRDAQDVGNYYGAIADGDAFWVLNTMYSNLSLTNGGKNFLIQSPGRYTFKITSDKKLTVEGFPATKLYDTEQSNNKTLSEYNNKTLDVELNGRKLYKDGYWNTLCLPFNLSAEELAEETNPLYGADIRTFTSSSFNQVDGALTLTFSNEGAVTSITAGTPYIVRWEDDGDGYILDPVFKQVTIKNVPEGSAGNGPATFKGIFNPFSTIAGDQYTLFIGGGNKLYYPEEDFTIGAFRAYFELNGITAGEPLPGEQGIKSFVLNFGDDNETTSIKTISESSDHSKRSDVYFTLDGRRLNDKPATAGLYIINGKKVVIK